MNNTAQSLGFGLAAGCLQLFVAERRSTALANAARGENLDHVRAVGPQPPDRFTNLLRRQPGINNRAERRQDPWPGQRPPTNGGAEILILRRAQTLNRGEPSEQRGPRIARFRQGRLCRCFLFVFHPPVRSKMPGNVVVDINPPRQHGQPAQIVRHALSPGIEPRDSAVLDDDTRVVEDVAAPVENRAGLEHDGLFLRNCNFRMRRPNSG